ncbi:uncharacterized protein LOC129565025 isoform X2 [Sitodiplosis mosellana]|uniref:uncharacterized protein LOC129565025 isoform X2 n=1 Tax=Sitodiplosis mosellana TaxID=263140 RepID=UPI0024450915|nr:uncharacterized protein LOC129565025 isoform X2 [Sitodiplosis mosellana]XP_055295328.1 uncharacterized protein LOC129565025 isoform X2 [Sitodiplosis mosellana]
MEPYTVQAEYSFQGENNDELRFKKGDIITVTQREDGGWWEGTLGEVTGWFPSNYVKEYKAPLPLAETVRTPEEIQASRQVVLNDLLESERAHVAEIRGLFENFLEPLQTSQIVNPDEYAQLLGNFIEVVETHEELLTAMESSNDRIGKLFLTKAATMKCIHQAYCAAHPRAIVILDKHSEQLEAYMERQGAASPGLLVLTTGLSKPFRRLDKYAAMLQELERHMESGHPDRGDTQRSISIYKDIASMCAATRRQKELELQVLTGPVRNWQGQDLSTLGDIIHMGSVAVGSDHRDRYFVLFPHTLLILSVSQRMSAFIYEGKLPLTGITVNRLEDTETIKNAFEIGGPLIERITAVCQGPNEANKWVELLSPDPIASFKPKSNESLKNMSNSAMSSPIHKENLLDTRGYCARTSMCYYSLGVPNYKITYPPKTYPSTASYTSLTNHYKALVKEGLMHHIVVKALLYPEFHRRFNTGNVRLRRHHRATSLRRRQSICSSSDLSRQDSESNDGCDTSAASSINFLKYSPSKQSEPSSTGTFVDNGAGVVDDCTREIFASFENMDTNSNLGRVPVTRDSDGSIMFTHAVDCDIGSRDSLQYYSKPVRVVIDRRKTTAVNSVVHTTTAQMIIGTKQEETISTSKGSPSEESEISGYNQRPFRANMACEDLVNLDDSLTIKGEQSRGQTIDERHSMPTLFVGNRFNCSSLTEVFIPSYRDKMDMNYLESSSRTSEMGDNETDDNNRHSNVSTATHSSSIDIAPVMPAPDQLSVELLYNSNGSPPENGGCDVIKPPSMFGANRKLSRELNLKLKTKSPEEMQRCTSSQMINLQTNPMDRHSKPSDKSTSNVMKKCGCCTESPCASQRSSDSGMAGSYTIQLTPETPIPNTHSEYERDQQIFPDIEQRLNGLMLSQSTHDFGRFDNIPFADSNHDSGQYGCNEESESEAQNRDSAAAKNMFELSSSQDTVVRRKSRCQSVEPLEPVKDEEQTPAEAHGVYKTGLYAHWWKKEQLPPGMLKDIIKMNRQSNSVTRRTADDSRGSDGNSRHRQQRRPNESGSGINASITAQAQPFIQSSPQLQSVQQPEREQRCHIKPQTDERSQPTAARSNAREVRPTGTRPKD